MTLLPEAPPATMPALPDLRLLALGQIQPKVGQMRRTMNQAALQELAKSIKARGVVQPIVVMPTPLGNEGQTSICPFEIIAGERRWRAASIAELQAIPSIVLTGVGAAEAKLLTATENLQREDVPLADTVHYVAGLLEDYKTPAEVARQLNKSDTWVSNILGMLTLPPSVKTAIEAGGLDSAEMAAELGRMVDAAPMHDLTLSCLVAASKGELSRAVLRRRYAELRGILDAEDASKAPPLPLDEPPQPTPKGEPAAPALETSGEGEEPSAPVQFVQATGSTEFLTPETSDRRYTVIEHPAATEPPASQPAQETAPAARAASKATAKAPAIQSDEPDEQLAYIDISEIHEELCGVYRLYVDPAAQAQFVEWLKVHKVIEPLIVRYRVKGGYGLVHGKRRLDAARECGMTKVPALIRRMTEIQALMMSAAMNEGHQAPTAADDTRLVGRAKLSDSVVALADLPGWSERRVLARLLLRETVAIDVLGALERGKVTLGHAELLSHLPTTAQEKLLPRLTAGELMPVAELQRQLLERSKDLKAAPFDRAGCIACKHNSEHQADILTHCIGRNRCSSLKCWTEKAAAATKLETAA